MQRISNHPEAVLKITSKRPSSPSHIRQKTPVSPLYILSSNKKTQLHRQISPFEKLTSKVYIYKTSLPSFLTQTPSKTRIKSFKTQTFDLPTAENSDEIKKSLKSDIEDFIKTGFWVEGFTLRIEGIYLKQKDLLTLRPSQELSIKLINACMSLIHIKNQRKIDEKKEPLERIFIVETQESNKLFFDSVIPVFTTDLLKYEYCIFRHIIFPLYIGYWVLIICDLSRKKVKVLDPIGIKTPKKVIREGVIHFIKNELNLDLVYVRNYFISKLVFEFYTESQVFDQFDSSVYILAQVVNLFISHKFQISPETTSSIRKHLLYLLLKHGTKTYIS